MAIETGLETGMERRRFYRRTISEFQLLTADVLPAGTVEQRQQRCLVLNVSECGLAVQPFLRLSPGNLVELRFGVPGTGRPFLSKGLVAWTGSGGPVGIQLIDPASEIRERLRKWVSDDLGLTTPQPSADDALPTGFGAQEFENALHLIARRVQISTRAHGAAIALGDAKSMVCRASAGVAPDLGAMVRAGLGLTGQCLSTGKLVQTADARSDSRIDVSIARQLQLGSAAIMPVGDVDQLAGVLCVFSRHPRAFDNFHVERLERFATVIAAAVQMSLLEQSGIELKPGMASRSEATHVVPKLLSPETAAVRADAPPLHRLESLWNMIETAHRRRRGSGPVQ
jgi:GAF domain-containing protein